MASIALPQVIPVLPLYGSVLMPNCILPMPLTNIRHISMLAEFKKNEGMIGLVQSSDALAKKSKKRKVPLFNIGCAGRVVDLARMDNEGVVALIQGVCRFTIQSEVSTQDVSRQFYVEYEPFLTDLEDTDETKDVDKKHLFASMRRYLNTLDISVNWSEAEGAPVDNLIHAIAMVSPFEPNEKQALLESHSIQDRMELLTALCEMGSLEPMNRSAFYH